MEENETRAVLSLKKVEIDDSAVKRFENSYYYYDLPISMDCFSKIIVGPEFRYEEIETLDNLNGKVDFKLLHTKKSRGTGIITNR